MRRFGAWAGALCAWLALASVRAEEHVRYVTENGITYRETQRVERTPVSRVEWEEREQTVMRPRFTTVYRDVPRSYYVPRVEYVYERQLYNWWNPFGPAQYTYERVPRTRWELKTETERQAFSYWDAVPDRTVVKQPVRRLGFAPQVTTQRVAVSGPPAGPEPQRRLAQQPDGRR